MFLDIHSLNFKYITDLKAVLFYHLFEIVHWEKSTSASTLFSILFGREGKKSIFVRFSTSSTVMAYVDIGFLPLAFS